MFVRVEGPGGNGLFQLADTKLLTNRPDVPPRDAALAKRLEGWLFRHTRIPPRWVYRPDEPDLYPSTWFRGDAHSIYIRKALLLSELLVARGVRLRVLQASVLPGAIVYRDRVQVVIWSRGGRPRGERIAPRTEQPRTRATLRHMPPSSPSPIDAPTWADIVKTRRMFHECRRDKTWPKPDGDAPDERGGFGTIPIDSGT